MSNTEKSLQNNNSKKEERKEKYVISEEDEKWFWDRYDMLLKQSPILSSFLDPQEPFTKLSLSVSEAVLTDSAPMISGFSESIISEQIDNETEQWAALFQDVFLVQSPSFIFANKSADKSYLALKTNDFLDWLYAPLRIQYLALIDDIITYNYSTYTIPLSLFKNK